MRLSVRAVGVKADDRSYDCASAGREVALPDGVTTDYYAFEHDFLRRVSTRFAKDVRRQPPGTIEWTGSITVVAATNKGRTVRAKARCDRLDGRRANL
ncbi:MAG TPA: hypothetical protein VIR38_08020, partial [Thalassobaculum sp.]